MKPKQIFQYASAFLQQRVHEHDEAIKHLRQELSQVQKDSENYLYFRGEIQNQRAARIIMCDLDITLTQLENAGVFGEGPLDAALQQALKRSPS